MMLLEVQQTANGSRAGSGSGHQKLCLEPSDVFAGDELSQFGHWIPWTPEAFLWLA
jgi:hypothetical protein